MSQDTANSTASASSTDATTAVAPTTSAAKTKPQHQKLFLKNYKEPDYWV